MGKVQNLVPGLNAAGNKHIYNFWGYFGGEGEDGERCLLCAPFQALLSRRLTQRPLCVLFTEPQPQRLLGLVSLAFCSAATGLLYPLILVYIYIRLQKTGIKLPHPHVPLFSMLTYFPALGRRLLLSP